jgi:outer membrane protein OmpA-like peptidoglycan-associated protein
LHIVGSIEPLPPPELAMRSVYFQTDVPTRGEAQEGLLPSEKDELKAIAIVFKQYIASVPDARLILSGHADKRGPDGYNMALSDRRVELAKNYLTEQGVPANNIETKGYGMEQNLTAEQVKQLLEQNPNMSEEDRKAEMWRLHTLVLANNRRVDITLSTTRQESLRQYPYKAEDFAKLIDRNAPKSSTEEEPVAKKEKTTN